MLLCDRGHVMGRTRSARRGIARSSPFFQEIENSFPTPFARAIRMRIACGSPSQTEYRR